MEFGAWSLDDHIGGVIEVPVVTAIIWMSVRDSDRDLLWYQIGMRRD